MSFYDLSILILSVSERAEKFGATFSSIERQAMGEPVEVLGFVNNRCRPVGGLRNSAVAFSRGQYIAFVDDDDRVENDYVASVLDAIRNCPHVDVVTFDVSVTGYARHGFPDKIARYSLDYGHDSNEGEFYRRLPNHLMAWRRDLARVVAFEEKSHGEDSSWAERMAKLARGEVRIDRVLYHYQFGDGSISMSPEAR